MPSPKGGPLGSFVPSAMLIEMAVDSLKSEGSGRAAAADRCKELLTAVGDADPLFVAGFQLGVRTVEVVLAMRGQKL